jgi:hypothetical protein
VLRVLEIPIKVAVITIRHEGDVDEDHATIYKSGDMLYAKSETSDDPAADEVMRIVYDYNLELPLARLVHTLDKLAEPERDRVRVGSYSFVKAADDDIRITAPCGERVLVKLDDLKALATIFAG